MNAFQALLDLVFPPRCLACQTLGSFLCDGCRAAIRPLPEPFCPTCRTIVDPERPSCRCRNPLPAFALAAGEFDGPLREAIHRFKYRGQSAGAAALAALLAPRLAGIVRPDHLLVPVALHPRRERDRGYNQAAMLAQALARDGTAELAERALVRIKETSEQARLNAPERARNMEGAFVARGTYVGRTIVLVDDVCTTGATLRAAARALHAAGAQRIYAAVVGAAAGVPVH